MAGTTDPVPDDLLFLRFERTAAALRRRSDGMDVRGRRVVRSEAESALDREAAEHLEAAIRIICKLAAR